MSSFLKYPLVIFLTGIVALQTFSKWALILGYEANKEYIARNLCVNRNNPADRGRPSCCRGKCFLAKKLAADQSGQEAPAKGAQKDETAAAPLFCQDFLYELPGNQADPLHHHSGYVPLHPSDHSVTLFQPPRTYLCA